MISVNLLSKKYGKNSKYALKDFSFNFEENKIYGLIGVNGAGKSTLLKMLSLQLFPTEGSVVIDELEASTENQVAIKEKIGFVSESAEFYGELKVSELLKNTLEFYSNADKYDEIVRKCALVDVQNQKIKTLSKGYRQRLSFAVALASDPKILILDEPISGLDPIQINEIRSLVKSLKSNRIIILSTHIMQEINALCDTILVIHSGKLVASGSEKELCQLANCSDIEQSFVRIIEKSEGKEALNEKQ